MSKTHWGNKYIHTRMYKRTKRKRKRKEKETMQNFTKS